MDADLSHPPEAIVETISFGTPTGSARIASAAIAVPPDPPSASRGCPERSRIVGVMLEVGRTSGRA